MGLLGKRQPESLGAGEAGATYPEADGVAKACVVTPSREAKDLRCLPGSTLKGAENDALSPDIGQKDCHV